MRNNSIYNGEQKYWLHDQVPQDTIIYCDTLTKYFLYFIISLQNVRRIETIDFDS